AARDRDTDVSPHRVAYLTSLQLLDLNARIRQHVVRFRPSHSNRRQLIADVGYLDIIHDDVTIEDGGDRRRLCAVGGNQQIIAAIVGDQISLNASLRAEQKAVHAVPVSKIANVVRDHPVQPADAVFAGQHQLGLPAHVKNGATFEQRAKLRHRITKRSWRLRPAIAAEAGARGRELLLNRCNTHTQYLIIAKRNGSLRARTGALSLCPVETSHPAMLP